MGTFVGRITADTRLNIRNAPGGDKTGRTLSPGTNIEADRLETIKDIDWLHLSESTDGTMETFGGEIVITLEETT